MNGSASRSHLTRPATIPLQQRGGYTLVELMVALSASVVLMGGMASAVAVSTRSLSLADTGSGARAISTDVQRDFLADLQRATGFTERTANAVTFTVPDRTGDGRPEKLRYAWSGTAGAPLTLTAMPSIEIGCPDTKATFVNAVGEPSFSTL